MGCPAGDGGRWRRSSFFAFDSYNGANNTFVAPANLQPDVVYRVTSVDSGLLGDRTGAELMETGIKIVRSPGTAAHVLSLIPQSEESARQKRE